MTPDQHLALIREKATALAVALQEAREAGVSDLSIVPTIIEVAQETGLIPEGGIGIPGLGF